MIVADINWPAANIDKMQYLLWILNKIDIIKKLIYCNKNIKK